MIGYVVGKTDTSEYREKSLTTEAIMTTTEGKRLFIGASVLFVANVGLLVVMIRSGHSIAVPVLGMLAMGFLMASASMGSKEKSSDER